MLKRRNREFVALRDPGVHLGSSMPARDPDLENRQAALADVRSVYRDLAARELPRSCTLRTECCQFRLTGKIPVLTRGEALVALEGFRHTGRKSVPAREDGACPMLDPRTSRCLIYQARPFGCRTHFCEPAGGPYARREVIDLIHRLEEIDARLGGDGPRSLTSALRDVVR